MNNVNLLAYSYFDLEMKQSVMFKITSKIF